MTPRQFLPILLLGSFPLFTSCAAHYQDLLRDRDAEIRELQSRLADARSQAAEYQRREQAALAKLEDAQAVQPVEATNNSTVDRVQAELGANTDVRYKSGRLSIGIDNTVTFSSGSTELKSSAGSLLRKVANLLDRDFADRRIYVEGHTDTDPIKKTAGRYRSNRHLSVERADAVARYLIETCGLPANQVAVVGYGEFDPRVPGRSDSAKARNRRVEIVVGEGL